MRHFFVRLFARLLSIPIVYDTAGTGCGPHVNVTEADVYTWQVIFKDNRK